VKKPKSMLKEKSDPMKTIGIGPIKELTLPDAIDEAMAEKGKTIYKEKCTLCHKPNKKFIGPPLKGIFKKRNPAWVMNMILNPEEMVQKDPIAKQLLLEYKGSPMINQNLTQQEARAILEYLRTL
ncbi:MAG TPA: cytochrome c, partial [Phaeodactylibacter sp.]|nr:cytochrome c [Phaeodactylibacter sp.]